MKKIIVALLFLGFTACTKNNCEQPLSHCFEGTLKYTSPAVDGVGWYLHVNDSSSGSYMILESSIPADVKTDGLKVAACLEKTRITNNNLTVPGKHYYYKITSITRR
jgi:hypothetical protein